MSDKSSTVARPNTTQVDRQSTSNSSSSGTRTGTGATTRGGSNKGSDVKKGGNGTEIRHSDNGSHVGTSTTSMDRTGNRTMTDISGNQITKPSNGGKPGNGGKPDNGGKPGNGGKPDNGGKPGNGNGHGGNGGHGHDGNGHGGNGHGHGGNHGYGGSNNNHFDYTGHHYGNDFHRNHINHSWSWSRPLPPPHRPYRPAVLTWYRPVIPVGWYPYATAPIIDRILGITFGTLFDTSIDYLYFNGYEIDGYADHVIYLRNVALLNMIWDDAMLSYDSFDRLVNAQFIYMTSGATSHRRYDRVYRSLCRIYGTPFTNSDGSLSWYGGGSTGWVTLSSYVNLGYSYTTLSIGY